MRNRTTPWHIAATFLCVCAAIAEEPKTMFSKTLPDGTLIKAVLERIELKPTPLTDQEREKKAEAERLGLEWKKELGATDVFSILISKDGKMTQVDRLSVSLSDAHMVLAGTESALPALPAKSVLYDVAIVDRQLFLLSQNEGGVLLRRVPLDNFELDNNGFNSNAVRKMVFIEKWARENRDAFPIKQAHIIPVDGGLCLFFESTKGNHFLWEVKGKDMQPKLLWKK